MDMWGTAGTPRRRRVIRAEFVIGAAGCVILGVFVLLTAETVLWEVVGVWLVGAGVNYVPLALYARLLSKPGELEAELVDVLDLRRELRKAGAQQFWIVVPFAVAIAALATEAERAGTTQPRPEPACGNVIDRLGRLWRGGVGTVVACLSPVALPARRRRACRLRDTRLRSRYKGHDRHLTRPT